MSAFKYLESEKPVNLARWHELERIMSDSMQNNYFKMVYQPLLSLGSGKLVGFESLVRLSLIHI